MPTILYGRDAPSTAMYDNALALSQVPNNILSNAYAKGWMRTLPTVAVTGTAIAGGVTEAAIVTGGETLIFTLTNGEWDTDVLAELALLTFSDLLSGSLGGGAGEWQDEMGVLLDWESDAVRTSDVVLTVTLPACAAYSIAADETVTFGIPYSVISINGAPITGTGNMVSSPTTFVITAA